jgi:hypothetical protein
VTIETASLRFEHHRSSEWAGSSVFLIRERARNSKRSGRAGVASPLKDTGVARTTAWTEQKFWV